MAKDFYQVLGLKRDADEKAIKGAYRKLAREHHCDVNPNNAGAEAKFRLAFFYETPTPYFR